MSIARRSLLLAVSTAVATVGSLAVTMSPAHATTTCRKPAYVSGDWNVGTCIRNDTSFKPQNGPAYGTVEAWGTMTRHPSNCSYYRVYIVDDTGDPRFSTSRRPCSEVHPPIVWVWDGEFGGHQVRSRVVAFTSSDATILSIDSPLTDP